ncbi:MAG TPA: caspase family protein [Bacteroidales bacterium]|nr:caspase family protein [Bacteroidales bacterium]
MKPFYCFLIALGILGGYAKAQEVISRKSDAKQITLNAGPPELTYMYYTVCDTGAGTTTLKPDGWIQAGEVVQVRFYIKNTGDAVANDVTYMFKSPNHSVVISKNFGNLGNLPPQQVKTFTIYVNPDRSYRLPNIPVVLTVNGSNKPSGINKLQINLAFNKKPPSPPPPPPPPPPPNPYKNLDRAPNTNSGRPDAIAVVIGIEKYKDLPDAIYSSNDAKLVSSYFKNTLGIDKVITDTNSDANWIFFDNMFNLENGELKKMVVPGVTELFVYFSGHGIPSISGEQIYVVPSDAKKDRISSQGINVTALYETLQHLKAKNVFVFVDACFSGISKQSESIKSENIIRTRSTITGSKSRNPWISNPSFYVFNSSSSDAVSLAFDESRSGLFTCFLCLGLQGAADENSDKKLTTGELQKYIYNNVLKNSETMISKQFTQFHGNMDYVLVEY